METKLVDFKEKYRPQFHFTPEENWMNDPNGLVYYQEEFHLFYQYHPRDNVWGPMHWGHAVSKDLVYWNHLPVAIEPDHNGAIFSGSIVVDKNDSSGFFNGEEGLVAIFTHADTYPDSVRPRQRQSLAYSNDNGRSWEMYEANPVLSNNKFSDFRDPKVYWLESHNKWIMVLVAGDHVRFYDSHNLKEWNYLSSFSEGSKKGVWECPDVFKLPVENESESKWILSVDLNPGGPQGGSGSQYFIGDFDGKKFINENSKDEIKWLDYGRDYYAAVSWNNIPEEDGRKLWIAWMSNWDYANEVPTTPWRSAMTIPRELKLKKDKQNYKLVQKPVAELKKIREELFHCENRSIEKDENILAGIKAKSFEIKTDLNLKDCSDFNFTLRKGINERTIIGYNKKQNKFYLDRRNSGENDFHDNFAEIHELPLELNNDSLKLQIFVDWSSVEIFINSGEKTVTDLIFPKEESDSLELNVEKGTLKVNNLDLYKLDSIWRK
ncbi:MAG: glycoside hydrolase family 32 protein [Bacillota bacterium]